MFYNMCCEQVTQALHRVRYFHSLGLLSLHSGMKEKSLLLRHRNYAHSSNAFCILPAEGTDI